MAYLLRVVLPDRPGMLGAVATALGEVGADILSLDVVERTDDCAVDDLLVELPSGGLVDRLITSAQSVPGVVVESVRPYAGSTDLHRDLALIDALAATPERALDLLAEHAPGVFRAGWALVLDPTGAVAASRGAPAAPPQWPTPSSAHRVEPREAWVPEPWQLLGTELAAAPVGSDLVILLGRPGGPVFRGSELLRLGHLAGLAATVAGALTP